jgi:uncharacterized secreted protein with C-terminal beta-propeller domain
MNTSSWYRRLALPLTTLALAGLVACGGSEQDPKTDIGPEVPPVTDADFALQPLDDCDALSDHFERTVVEELIRQRYYGYDLAADGAEGAPSTNGDRGDDGPTDYTTTNVQEQGVDEADLVKTDGKFIYIAHGESLKIVKSWPVEQTDMAGEINLGGQAHSLFLYNDRAVVFSYVYDQREREPDAFGRTYFYGTRVTTVDVSDRENPRAIESRDIEGWFVQGRMINGQVYIVLNSWLPIPQDAWNLVWNENLGLPEMDYNASPSRQRMLRDQARRILRPHVHRVLAGHDIREILPRQRVNGQEAGRLFACSDLYRPSQVAQPGMLTVVQIDLEGDSAPRATGLLANGWQIYASQDNLYVALSSWWWWWGWGGDTDRSTHIHKFALTDDGPRYTASGKVEGWLLNQFGMSEYDGHLRVATSDFVWWTSDEGDNQVTVLRESRGRLRQVGKVEGFAPGERIYAVRMMGEKGYIVTFRQTDPLFTVDLSDHTAPRIVGELHIPGFSSYLHPAGPDHLLAVGMDADDEGRIRGVQVQIFDVSDFANPKLAHKHVITTGDWSSWSEALWDHHAFTYHRGKLSIPIYKYEREGNDWRYFSGLGVFDIDLDEGIKEVGFIDHSDLAARQRCPYQGADREYCGDFYEYNWYASMRRSIYIEDNLFSLSHVGLKVSLLNDPAAEMASVLLVPER